MVPRIAMVYGYGQFVDGKIDCQTQDRCETALYLFWEGTVSYIVITAGVSKNGVGMGDGMKDFFLDFGVPAEKIIYEPGGNNTITETDACIVACRKRFKKFRIFVVSSWYHLPRIFWFWLMRGRIVRLAGSFRDVHWVDLRIEPIKIFWGLIFPYRTGGTHIPSPTRSLSVGEKVSNK